MSSSKPHVLIIGAGLGGLFFAQILRKHGVSFEIFDKHPTERTDEGFWPKVLTIHSVIQSFENLLPGDLPPARQTLDICSRRGLETQSCIYVGNNPRAGVMNTPQTPLMHISHLEMLQWLSTNVQISRGKEAVGIKEVDDKVTVTFKDGTSSTGDILVGVDGVDSFVREYLLGESKPKMTPLECTIIYGQLTLSGEDLERQLEMGHASTVIPTKPDPIFDVLYTTLLDFLPDGKSARFAWHLGGYEAGALPKDHEVTPETLRAKALELTKNISPEARKIVEETPLELLEGYFHYKEGNVEDLPEGRITLLGDAAHTSAPFKGDGAVQAFRDAIRLGNGIALLGSPDSCPVPSMINEYHAEMIPRGVAAVRAGKAAISEYTNLLSRPRLFGNRLGPIPMEKVTLQNDGTARAEVVGHGTA